MAVTSDMSPTPRKAASSGTKSVSETPNREKDLEAQVTQLQSDLKDITETLRKLTGEKAGEVRSMAKAELRDLQKRGQHLIDEAQDQAGEIEKQLKDVIREKPLTAVAGAMGIGFVLALLTRH